MSTKHTPGPRGRSAMDQETLDGYRDLAVRDARTIANLSEQNAELLAALRLAEGTGALERHPKVDAVVRALLARVDGAK